MPHESSSAVTAPMKHQGLAMFSNEGSVTEERGNRWPPGITQSHIFLKKLRAAILARHGSITTAIN